MWCATHSVHRHCTFMKMSFGEAEIHNANAREVMLLLQQKVLELEVTVNNTETVAILHAFEKLPETLSGCLLRVRATLEHRR